MKSSALPASHHPLQVGHEFRGFLIRFRYDLSICLPSWRIQPEFFEGGSYPLSFELGGSPSRMSPADEDFYFRASDGSVSLPAAGYNYGGNWAISTGGTSTRENVS